MGDIRIHEKPNAVPNNAAVFAIEMQQNGVWYTRKVTWEQLVGLIGALNNLQNYYLKTETYTKTEVNQLIAQIPSFTVEIVQELPTEDISTTTLYLVPKTTAGTLDYYDEFINLDGTTSGWEYVGKTEVDLSNYYTKAETEAYVKGDGADYIAGTKTFSSLTTTAKTILGAINEAAGAASGAQTDATQALADASAAQGTANSASSAASAAQTTADTALTAAGNAASAASAAQGTANTALTTAQSMAVSVTNTITPGDTTKKLADVTQNSTTTSIYGDDAEKVVVTLTDTQTTAAGNPVTLTTAQAGGAKSALVTFAPKQSGTGDPSPSNIRPISGWDGLELMRTGVNQWNEECEVGGYSTQTGEKTTATNRIRNKNAIRVFPNAHYYIKSSDQIRLFWYDSNMNYIDTYAYQNVIWNAPSNAYYINFQVATTYGTTYNHDISINYPETDTEYHAYNGETHTATFESAIPGGEYDFVSGEGSSEWGYIASYNGETLPSEWLSDRDVYAEGTTPTTGAEVSYRLATPTEISLTPADVELNKGTNVISTDGDTVQVEYSELPQGNLGAVIDYIQTLEARVKALES